MAVYQYEAFAHDGTKVTGIVEASTLQLAQVKLRSQGLFVKVIHEDSAKRDRELFPALAKYLHNITRKEIGIFARQLGTLLGAGIALDEALQNIFEQTENPQMRKILVQMKQSIVEGKNLSETFADHGDIFPPVYENMIKVGEATGNYENTLIRLAELEDKNQELKSKAITALVYPAIMLVISVLVVLFLLTSVVPQIENMYANLEGELPLPTRIVLAISNSVQKGWPFFLVSLAGLVYAFSQYKATEKGKRVVDSLTSKLPFFGLLLTRIQVGRFARNLGTLLESNVSLLHALEIVSNTVTNATFKDELVKATSEIREGSTIRDALKNSEVLPQMTKGMISAGEATDRLPELLMKVAIIMEDEVDAAVKRLTTALEPLMIVVMGGIVAGIMTAIMMPLYKMGELLN
jgi:general secretion pathway protein F